MEEVHARYARLYQDTLLNDVIPFWEKHSLDWKYGGYFTCLDRQGNRFDHDKFIWPQGRQVWTFSKLYNEVNKEEAWLDIARNGAEFLKRYALDPNGDVYFSLTREGKPLVQPYNISSDCYATLAFGQYAVAAQLDEYYELAQKSFRNILKRRINPKGQYEKTTGVRPLRRLGFPMILSNLVVEIKESLEEEEVESILDNCVKEITEFVDPETGLVREYISTKGETVDCFEGRLLNPGHGIEAMWFLMDIGIRRRDKDLINRCIEVVLTILDYSWDEEHGGLFYFIDLKGHPPQQLEWDQKLWWVHLEALIALAKGYMLTGRKDIWTWYQKVHEYTWSHFPDPEYGEWFGYLKRNGKPHLTLKGGKWKGCYHLPRALYVCWKTFEKLKNQKYSPTI